MFKNLTDFSIQRTKGQAFGFWLSFFILGALLGFVTSLIAAKLAGVGEFKEAYEMGLRIGRPFGAVYVLTLSTLICNKKSLGFGWYIVALFVSPILAIFATLSVGLIPVAFLTTRPMAMDIASSP